jgi:protein phosphatase
MSPDNSSTVRSFGGSYIGRRRNNEDSLGKREPGDPELRRRRGSLYVVCDGMGGHSAGEVASRLGVETVLKEYYAGEGAPVESLVAAVEKANECIYQAAGEELEREGMGCTVVACVVLEERAVIAHVGDSRVYLLRHGELKLLTRDHLHITEEMGVAQEEAKKHHLRHMLSRALGRGREVKVDTQTLAWEAGDRLLLCTDGLSNALTEAELAAGLSEPTPREAVARLLEQAEASQAEDNSSGIVVALLAPEPTVEETPAAAETPPEPGPVTAPEPPSAEAAPAAAEAAPREAPPSPGLVRRWLRGLRRRES